EGLLLAITDHAGAMADIQRSWLGFEGLTLRYEDLVADERRGFGSIIEAMSIDIGEGRLLEIVEALSFERLTRRRKGDEDRLAHLRKGVAGDWRNHFTDSVKDAFKARFGAHLVETGYESGLDW
ncbi:MAG: sulfotransferase domain-containing protein, partial [Phycisphaerales bacterium]|nr:sulfotransferase domain-containing protein [Phycisphaerales bacterium]